jgi:hypothetical protein
MSEEFRAHLAGFGPGSLLAGYRLETQVGTGGMAAVFRARDERLGRPVALKILAPALASDLEFRRRFIAESRAAAAVDDPHIIPVYEAGEVGGVLFIAMRFVMGGDLRHVLAREGALPPDRAAAFISPVASALDAAHAVGLVHRDVKPANILVDARRGRPDHVYLSDFGVSKGATSATSLTGTGQFLGTLHYCAPEQIQGLAVDGRADQYALACVAFQLLTGEAPFEREQDMAVLYAHLAEPPPSLASRRPGLSWAADQVLARALAKAPEQRYRSCRDFADALREAFGLAPYTPRAPASAPGYPQPGPSTLPSAVSRGPVAGGAEWRGPGHARRSGIKALSAVGVVAVVVAAGVAAAVWLSHPSHNRKATVAAPRTSLASPRRGLPGHIIFLTTAYSPAHQFWNMHEISPDGRDSRFLPIGDALCCFSPALSPDGTKLAFSGEGMMTVTDLQGHLATGAWSNFLSGPLSSPIGSFTDPVWSPSGKQIAFLYLPGGSGSPEIDVINADGTGRRTVLRSSGIDAQGAGALAWSPDGTQLAFGTTPTGTGTPSGTIAVVGVSGGPAHPLVTGIPGGVTALSWAPGPQPLFTDGHAQGIWEADGQGGAKIVLPCDCQDMSWAPDRVHFAAVRHGQGVIVASVAGGIQATIGPADVTYVQWGGPASAPLATPTASPDSSAPSSSKS